MKFQKGDIITGTPESDREYGITTSNAIMKVIRTSPYFRVKIINHKHCKEEIGCTFDVHPKYFQFANNAIRRLDK